MALSSKPKGKLTGRERTSESKDFAIVAKRLTETNPKSGICKEVDEEQEIEIG